MIQSNSLKKTKSSDKGINKPDYNINRGFELILTGGKKKSKPSHLSIINLGGRSMLAISLVFGSFLTLMFLLIGIIGGWVARDYMLNYREIPRPHPEMFDELGNLVPDEIVAFRFENNYDNDEEDDD